MPSAHLGQGSRSRPPPGVTTSRPASSDVTLDAIANVLDDRLSPLRVSHHALTTQFGNLQIEFQQSIHAHDARITAVETHIASVQASAVDGQARESIQRVEQQLKLSTISISEGSRSSNVHTTSHMPKDTRVSDAKSLTVVMGNLDNESTEVHCRSWMTT